uniref:Uncharacterized protein n=1 Tax=Timema shepardi TaxID=629360 RepID=A0A7R9B083_TIMSH|nr:unnamed protein product [Timema shepardi]
MGLLSSKLARCQKNTKTRTERRLHGEAFLWRKRMQFEDRNKSSRNKLLAPDVRRRFQTLWWILVPFEIMNVSTSATA